METQAWLKASLAGEFRAFAPVVRAYQLPLYNYLFRRHRSVMIAQDLTQETLLRAYQHLSTYRTEQPFRPWLFAIARRLSLDFIRARQPWEEIGTPIEEKHWVTETTAHHDLESHQTKAKLDDALEQLGEATREVVMLHYAGGLKVREIAATLDMPLNTVLSHLSRGRKELKNILGTT